MWAGRSTSYSLSFIYSSPPLNHLLYVDESAVTKTGASFFNVISTFSFKESFRSTEEWSFALESEWYNATRSVAKVAGQLSGQRHSH